MSEKKKYQVSIFEENYVLLSDEPEERVRESAELVNSLMKEIAHKLGISGTRDAGVKQCAILTALRMANKVLNMETDQKFTQAKHEALMTAIDRALLSLSQSP